MSLPEFHEVLAQDLSPGDRIVTSFGICTLERAIFFGDDRVTLMWKEPQPSVTQSMFNTVTCVREITP